ncbi:MAG: hypothetical protein WCD63_06935 [Terrimicrobiaceae bacterium]
MAVSGWAFVNLHHWRTPAALTAQSGIPRGMPLCCSNPTPPFPKGPKRALGLVIDILRNCGAGVVGLSEVWESADCDQICSALEKIYPFWVRGPRDGLPSLNGGGLLLLSRHPITAHHETIYRHCSGDDCLTPKGVLHACIQAAGHPCGIDVFLSHAQAPKPTSVGAWPVRAVRCNSRSGIWPPSSPPAATRCSRHF